MRASDRNGGTRGGFTLVELMVVVVIVSILALLVVPMLGGSYEAEFNKAVRVLTQDLMRARSLAMARREYHSIMLVDAANYRLQAFEPTTSTYVTPPISQVALPASARITNVRLCADLPGATCPGQVAPPAELRFVNTGELLACTGGGCTPALKSMTIYLTAHKPDGSASSITKRIVIFMTTGNIKVF